MACKGSGVLIPSAPRGLAGGESVGSFLRKLLRGFAIPVSGIVPPAPPAKVSVLPGLSLLLRSRAQPPYPPNPTEDGIESIGGRLIEAVEEVTIRVECGPDRGVTEPFLDHLGVLALPYQQGGVGVPEVVRAKRLPDRRCDSRFPESPPPIPGAECRSFRRGEHQVVAPRAEVGQVRGNLVAQEVWEGQRPSAPVHCPPPLPGLGRR